jgi:oligopeptide/dipeptide ABC transporter ATP-binding protein
MDVTADRPSLTKGADPILSVRNLETTFAVRNSTIKAVRDVSFDLRPGEILGVVGESGSGKSATVNSLLRLLPPPPTAVTTGSVVYGGEDLLTVPARRLRAIRGKEISMIFQDPSTSFNPVQTIGWQIAEAIKVHDRRISRTAVRARVIELLTMVGVPSPQVRFGQFPHEYSGGMRQRAMIAMALANSPKIIIADEPTTALDVTIQAQILDLLEKVRTETQAATILITHDLGIIAEVADRVLVMYAGKIVESGQVREVFTDPQHPYTLGLLASLPRIDTAMEELLSIPGQPPSMSSPPSGCAFHVRCKLTQGRDRCRQEQPALTAAGGSGGHLAACHFSDEMESEAIAIAAIVGTDVRAGTRP